VWKEIRREVERACIALYEERKGDREGFSTRESGMEETEGSMKYGQGYM
jgi:hypothetical protein